MDYILRGKKSVRWQIGMAEMKEPTSEQTVFKNISDIIPIIGGFGRFQRLLTACFCVMIFPSTFSILMMYFTARNPPWKCAANSTVCRRNGTFPSDDDTRCDMQRGDWEYTMPPGFSIITQFDLQCGQEWAVHLTTSIFFIGWAFGAVVLGWISDNYGRKIVIFPSYFIILLVGSVAAFSPSIGFLVVCRFIIGFCIPGAPIQCLVLISEFVSTKYRPLSVVIVWFFFSSALCLLSLKAYYVRQWSTLILMCTVPYVFILAFYKFVPESIRWLHLHGRLNDLKRIFQRMGYWNKKGEMVHNFTVLQLPHQDNKHKSSPLDIFRTKKLAVNTLAQGFGWLVNGMVYYGMSLAASDLGGSLYRNFALLSAIEAPALILTIYLCDLIGRKKTVCGAMAIGSVTCLAIAFIPVTDTNRIVRITLGILGKCCITTSFSSIYTWSLEIYSTNIRAEGIGFLQVTSRIGAASSPWIAKALRSIHPVAPFTVMGVLGLLAAIVLLILPETKGKPTQEVHEEKQTDEDEKNESLLLT